MNVKSFIRQNLKNAVNRIYLPAVYELYRRRPIEKGKVLFADSNSFELPESMRLVYNELESRGMDIGLYLTDLRSCGFVGTVRYMTAFMKAYATAEYVFISNYFVPVTSCRKRRGTKVVQLWHSCGLLKKFAYDTKEDISPYYKGDVTKNFSLITVSSKACVKVWQNALRLDERRSKIVRATGVSRTDVFFDESYLSACRDKLFDLRPDLKGKKIVLYAPTFRGTAAEPQLVGKADIDRLEARLGEGWAVIQKLHPHLQKNDDLKMSSSELFACADVLITDYSSLLFEYILLEKPFVIFAPDYEQYKQGRGFYEDPADFPCEFITDGDKLADAVKQSFGRKPDSEYKAFIAHHSGACDGKATGRILKLIGIDK